MSKQFKTGRDIQRERTKAKYDSNAWVHTIKDVEVDVSMVQQAMECSVLEAVAILELAQKRFNEDV